jgi:hypothetical protein
VERGVPFARHGVDAHADEISKAVGTRVINDHGTERREWARRRKLPQSCIGLSHPVRSGVEGDGIRCLFSAESRVDFRYYRAMFRFMHFLLSSRVVHSLALLYRDQGKIGQPYPSHLLGGKGVHGLPSQATVGLAQPFPQLADGLMCLFLSCADDPVDPAFEVGRSAF